MRLQITLTGRYQGRGFWRQIFGSGPFRLTPIDVAIADKDRETVATAATAISQILAQQEPTDHRLGSLFNATGVQIVVRTTEQ